MHPTVGTSLLIPTSTHKKGCHWPVPTDKETEAWSKHIAQPPPSSGMRVQRICRLLQALEPRVQVGDHQGKQPEKGECLYMEARGPRGPEGVEGRGLGAYET